MFLRCGAVQQLFYFLSKPTSTFPNSFLPLTTDHHDPTVQSRVRRLIGRRRAGLDRYVGVLSREAGQSHDNIDPITDLLSQLSGELESHIEGLLVSA